MNLNHSDELFYLSIAQATLGGVLNEEGEYERGQAAERFAVTSLCGTGRRIGPCTKLAELEILGNKFQRQEIVKYLRWNKTILHSSVSILSLDLVKEYPDGEISYSWSNANTYSADCTLNDFLEQSKRIEASMEALGCDTRDAHVTKIVKLRKVDPTFHTEEPMAS